MTGKFSIGGRIFRDKGEGRDPNRSTINTVHQILVLSSISIQSSTPLCRKSRSLLSMPRAIASFAHDPTDV